MTSLQCSTSARLAAACLVTAVVLASCTSDPVTDDAAPGAGEEAAAVVLADLVTRLDDGAVMTYTAEYATAGGGRVTLVQQPPASAVIGPAGRFILTADSVVFCTEDKGNVSCEMAATEAITVGDAPGLVAGAAGPGFVSYHEVTRLLDAAAAVPTARTQRARQDVGGQPSNCVTVTGLAAAGTRALPDGFAVCVTDAGILASFDGLLAGPGEVSIDLVSFTTSADPTALGAPAGASVVEVDVIGPPR